MSSVQYQVVHEAGCEWTTDHIQTEAWFEECSRKALEADFLLVLFTPEYKNLYSEALAREADMIRQVGENVLVMTRPPPRDDAHLPTCAYSSLYHRFNQQIHEQRGTPVYIFESAA